MMSAAVGLDASQRSTLERLVVRARALLEADLAAQAEGRFGIHRDGTIEDEAALPDDTTDKVTRRDLEQIVAHLRTLGEDAPGSVARLLREAAFTHLNRLFAIRIAEAVGLLPESLASGVQSRGFKDLGEIMPILASDYRAYVRLCGDELAADAPALFDPRNPLLALEPSTAAFDELVGLLADVGTSDIWLAPDALGWTYQLFNSGEERREMREASAPRNSRELAVRNQFFTPRYVVDFLVQNTIGRRLMESDPTSPLLNDLPLLVDPPTERGLPLDLHDVKCLDPACGSGHFLLGCYDILERAWDLAGVAPSESAPKIVASLWGVDIDLRCAQVASAAIVLRARRHCRDLPLPRPNIVTARGLPGGSSALPPELDLTAAQRSLIDRVSAVLADAPLLGPLLMAEDALDEEIRHGAFGGRVERKPGTLELTDQAAEATELELRNHLQAIADQASSSVVERLLAAEADDALRLVDIVRERYDVVLMNPPFGEPVPETKAYLKKAYRSAPGSTPLEACFVLRGQSLVRRGGYVGAITSRSGMFLSTYETWRREALLGGRVRALVDLGFGVMQQAMVEAAAYVTGDPDPAGTAVFIRLLRDSDRAAALHEVVDRQRSGIDDPRLYRAMTSDLEALPRSALAYWISSWAQRMFAELPPIEASVADVRVGGWPGDNFRLLRLWWEPAMRPQHPPRWVTYAKGGTYAPFYAEPHLRLAWDDERGTFLGFFGRKGRATPIPENVSYYFREGLTWSTRTASNFAVRILPTEAVFGHKGPGIFASDRTTLLALLGWLNSRYARAFVEAQVAAGEEVQSGSASRSYEAGLVQRIPWPGPLLDEAAMRTLASNSLEVAALLQRSASTDETSLLFVRPAIWPDTVSLQEAVARRIAADEERTLEILRLTWDTDVLLGRALSVDPETNKELSDDLGPHPDSYGTSEQSGVDQIVRELYPLSIDALVDAVVSRMGGGRYLSTMSQYADRRIELLAHAAGCKPSQVVDARERYALTPPGEPGASSRELVSYLVGAAFGRWDVTMGGDEAPAVSVADLFDSLPAVSPAMLSFGPGVPGDYPLELPSPRILVDQPGANWDLEMRVERAALAVFEDAELVLTDVVKLLNRSSVRQYLRKDFFKDHLSRYSKSRRRAPIYWPLYVPSGNWGAWVYAPTLSRETLFAVARAAAERLAAAETGILHLQRERETGGAGRSKREVVDLLSAEERLADELRRFRDEAERVAGLGWEPDLDDGIVLCAAPLADLFPAWSDAKSARAELRKGKYEWATVAEWADQL